MAIAHAEVALNRTAGPEARTRSRHPIARFVCRRVAAGVATLLVASMLIFSAIQILPGDVAHVVLGKYATPQSLAQVRSTIGLDKPLPKRYVDWLTHAAVGDFGNSSLAAAQGNPHASVWSSIRKPLVNSALIAGLTLLVLIPVALVCGALTAIRAGRATDNILSGVTLALAAMPEFFVGTVLITIFFTALHWLPPISQVAPGDSVFSNPKILVLPIATLLAVSLAFTIRLVRAATIDALRQDYVAMARLNGQREARVVWRYALRNALAPSVQAIAQTAQYLFGGIIIVESVFAYPGIGTELVSAVTARDVTTVAGIAMILATAAVVINIVADLVVVLLVPRLRTQV